MNRLRTRIFYPAPTAAEQPKIPGRRRRKWKLWTTERDRSLRLRWHHVDRIRLPKILGVSRAQMFRRARKLGLYIAPRKRRAHPISTLST